MTDVIGLLGGIFWVGLILVLIIHWLLGEKKKKPHKTQELESRVATLEQLVNHLLQKGQTGTVKPARPSTMWDKEQ